LRWINIALGIVVMAIIVTFLKELKAIFIPLTFAMFLSLFFSPFYSYMRRKKIPKPVIFTVMLVIIFVLFTLIGALVYTGVNSFRQGYPKYEEKIVTMVRDISLKFEFIQMQDVREYLRNQDWFEIIDRFSLTEVVSTTMGSFVDFLIKLLLTIIFMLFILAGRERFVKRLSRVLSPEESKHSTNIYKKMKTQIQHYLVGKTLISLGTALVGMLFIAIFGVDFVIISGLFLFILNYIPNIGSIIASLLPILICFIQYGFGWRLIAVSGALLGTQLTFGNVIEPKYLGMQLNLSPVVILSGLIFWAWVWGPVGMVLAVPIMFTINIIAQEFDALKVVSAVISDDDVKDIGEPDIP